MPPSPFFFLYMYEALLHVVSSSLGLLRVSQIELKNLTTAQVLQALCKLYPNITVPLEPKCSLRHSVK